jgi:hypothetical protein
MGDLVLPSRRDRVIASSASAFLAVVLYVVTTIVLGALAIFLFARESIAQAWSSQAAGGLSMRVAVDTTGTSMPGWVSWTVVVGAGLMAWLGAARFVRGLVVDPVGSVRALGPDGAFASRGRTLVRAGVPVWFAVLGSAVGAGPYVLLVLLVCAGLAAYRSDRRGPFELVSGIRLESTVPVKFDRDQRRAELRAARAAAHPDEE